MSKRHFLGALALAIGALTISSTAASAQHPGWLPWHGCWRADGAPVTELLCIVPDGAGVRMVTLESGTILGESRVITDGRARPVQQEGCSGTEQAQWSADGHRVFLSSDLVCEGGLTRKVSGIFSITGLTEWVSAQSVTIDGKTATRSLRYTAVQTSNVPASLLSALNTSPSVRVAAREAALAAITEQDIDEAINFVDPAAVQEWLGATGQPYQLANETQEPGVPSASALELVGGVAYAEPYVQREVVHVVERPTYVHHTTYVHSVRSCWDPFVSGWVSFGYGLGVGVTYSDCGRRHYSRYSPWGYDLYGWRFVHAPLVFIRSGPRIVRPIIVRGHRDRDYYRDRYGRDYDRRGIPVVRRDRDDDDDRINRGGRATREGYTSGRAVARPAASPQRVAPTSRSEPATRIAPGPRTSPTPRAAPSTRTATSRTAQPVRISPTRRAEPVTRFQPSARPQSAGVERSARTAQSRESSARASSGYRGSASTRAAPAVRPSSTARAAPSYRPSSSSRAAPSYRPSSSTRAAPSVRSSGSSRAAVPRAAPSVRSSSSSSVRASSGSTSSRSSGSTSRTARPRN